MLLVTWLILTDHLTDYLDKIINVLLNFLYEIGFTSFQLIEFQLLELNGTRPKQHRRHLENKRKKSFSEWALIYTCSKNVVSLPR